MIRKNPSRLVSIILGMAMSLAGCASTSNISSSRNYMPADAREKTEHAGNLTGTYFGAHLLAGLGLGPEDLPEIERGLIYQNKVHGFQGNHSH